MNGFDDYEFERRKSMKYLVLFDKDFIFSEPLIVYNRLSQKKFSMKLELPKYHNFKFLKLDFETSLQYSM